MHDRTAQRILLAVAIAACTGGLLPAAEELATFQVPDLSPPDAPAPDGGDIDDDAESLPAPENPFVDDQPIPATMDYPDSALPLLGTPPVSRPYPGAHLWAGRHGHHETLVPPGGCPPTWVAADVLWLQREGPDDYMIATDGNQAQLRNDNFDFDYEAGVRVTYGEVVRCVPVEITYFGTHDWNSAVELDGDDNLLAPTAPTGGSFVDADRVEANYGSELHSIEVNTLRFDGCNLTWRGGLRYIDAEEDFAVRAFNDGTPEDSGLLAIGTDNRLLGLQGGATYSYGCDGWCFDATGTIGGYANFAERDYLIDDGIVPANNLMRETNDIEFAFVGQLQFGITRHLGCGLKLRGGYELMWIEGLALAAEQTGDTTGGALPAFDVDGSILYDGGYIGLEWHR